VVKEERCRLKNLGIEKRGEGKKNRIHPVPIDRNTWGEGKRKPLLRKKGK